MKTILYICCKINHMAKMKEIYIEILDLFDGQIPENFDFDEYINKKIQEKNE